MLFTPGANVAVDRKNPLSAALSFAYSASGGIRKDLVSGLRPTGNTTKLSGGSLQAVANATNMYWGKSLFNTAGGTGSGDFTLFCYINIGAFVATDFILFGLRAGGATTEGASIWAHQKASAVSANNLTFIEADGIVVYRVDHAVGITPGKWHKICAVRQGKVLTLYIDGVATSATVEGVPDITNGNVRTVIGSNDNGSGGSSRSGAFTLKAAYAWNRALRPDEVAILTNNPYEPLAPRSISRLLSVPASGSSPAVLVSVGSAQANNSVGGSVSTEYQLSATGSVQANNSVGGSVGTVYQLSATGSTQNNNSVGSSVSTAYQLSATGSAQNNNSIGGSVSTANQLSASGSAQANNSVGGSVGTAYQLSATGSAQNNNSVGGSVSTANQLSASGSTQSNNGVGGSVGTVYQLSATGSVQSDNSTGGSVGTAYQLSATGSTQDNNSVGGAVSSGYQLACVGSTQNNNSVGGSVESEQSQHYGGSGTKPRRRHGKILNTAPRHTAAPPINKSEPLPISDTPAPALDYYQQLIAQGRPKQNGNTNSGLVWDAGLSDNSSQQTPDNLPASPIPALGIISSVRGDARPVANAAKHGSLSVVHDGNQQGTAPALIDISALKDVAEDELLIILLAMAC